MNYCTEDRIMSGWRDNLYYETTGNQYHAMTHKNYQTPITYREYYPMRRNAIGYKCYGCLWKYYMTNYTNIYY
jgi:hypothetical protein